MLAGQLMAVLDTSVVNVAVPSIHAGLHASGPLQLIVAGYTISYAVLMVTGARLGDLFGLPGVPRRGGRVHPGLARLRAGPRPPGR